MQDLISVELTGHHTAFRLEPLAHADLGRYLDQARTRLRGDPDRDEILGDLERSIGDRLNRRLSGASDRIGADDMREVLTAVGEVDQDTVYVPGPVAPPLPPRGRFLCLIKEGRWIGGICLGIAAYGEFRVDWVRTIFVILGLVTGGTMIAIYLIAMLFLPVVASVPEYERLRDAPRGANPRMFSR